MEPQSEIQDILDETLRKIGRNVLLFQELESVLKFLAATQHPSTPLSRAEAARDKRIATIRTQTLGQVAGDVLRALHADLEPEFSTPQQINESWLAYSVRIGITDPASIEANRTTLDALVAERNDLVHHFLSRWKPHDIVHCRALAVELDAQRSRVVCEIERYRAYANAVKKMAMELKAFLDSEEGKHQLDLAFLQQSQLAAALTLVAKEHARPDGWVLLSSAGRHLQRLLPEELDRLKAKHGDGSLQKLVQAMQLFEVATETSNRGGSRALYRVRLPSVGLE